MSIIRCSKSVQIFAVQVCQVSFVRRHRQLTSMTAVCTKCFRQVNHADGLPWTHLTCSAGIALGCLSDAVSTSNWQHWCLSRYTAAHAPSYLSEACKSAPEASLHRHLHSSAAITCITPWSRTRLGDRSFDVTVTRTVVSPRRVQISAWGQSASPSPLVCCHHGFLDRGPELVWATGRLMSP